MIDGDCIELFPFQIYNVCDGIAQCEDLSDEGPEVRVEGRGRDQTLIILFDFTFSVQPPARHRRRQF